jgi:hypothetical protein
VCTVKHKPRTSYRTLHPRKGTSRRRKRLPLTTAVWTKKDEIEKKLPEDGGIVGTT